MLRQRRKRRPPMTDPPGPKPPEAFAPPPSTVMAYQAEYGRHQSNAARLVVQPASTSTADRKSIALGRRWTFGFAELGYSGKHSALLVSGVSVGPIPYRHNRPSSRLSAMDQ